MRLDKLNNNYASAFQKDIRGEEFVNIRKPTSLIGYDDKLMKLLTPEPTRGKSLKFGGQNIMSSGKLHSIEEAYLDPY